MKMQEIIKVYSLNLYMFIVNKQTVLIPVKLPFQQFISLIGGIINEFFLFFDDV